MWEDVSPIKLLVTESVHLIVDPGCQGFGVYTHKILAYLGYPSESMSLSDCRHALGVKLHRDAGVPGIDTLGEWSTLKGGGSIEVFLVIPQMLNVDVVSSIPNGKTMALELDPSHTALSLPTTETHIRDLVSGLAEERRYRFLVRPLPLEDAPCEPVHSEWSFRDMKFEFRRSNIPSLSFSGTSGVSLVERPEQK